MLSFRDLQLEAEKQYRVEDTRNTLLEVQQYFINQPYYEDAITSCFEELRELPAQVGKDCGAFYISSEMSYSEFPDEFKQEAIGMCWKKHLIFGGRLVYPVYDVKGQIMGLCGWDKWDEPKYLDSRNQGYKAKRTTFYGMEKLPEYYNSNKPVFVVEGIVCCLFLRLHGFQALAVLGSNMTPYVVQILKRFGHRLVLIPDSDAAGAKLVRQAKYSLPMARIWQNLLAKDTDDSRKVDQERVLKDLANADNPFYISEVFIAA